MPEQQDRLARSPTSEVNLQMIAIFGLMMEFHPPAGAL
jgi:hypothetical protein